MLDLLHKMTDLIPVGGAVAVFAGAVDFLLRLIPTQKPLSIAYLVADVCHGIGNLFDKVGDFLDKVLPQKVKGSEPPK